MTTHAPMARVPFASLDASRLQQLSSAKNRQNGLAAQSTFLDGKANLSFTKPSLASTAAKRPFEISIFEDVDSENIDPSTLASPSKKSKSDGSNLEKPSKPFTFISTSPSAKAMPPPPSVPSRLTTPARPTVPTTRAALTAPAGRSPKRKFAAGIVKNRRVSAPYARIESPFASTTGDGLPFSLDAALAGTFSTPTTKPTTSGKSAGATLKDSMPKNWFFEIYEDAPGEEAANLMEHSTLTLDLSSDDEEGKGVRDERGKENCPPEGYEAPVASRSATTDASARSTKSDLIRKKVKSEAMDDRERSPLSDLETEYFIPVGLDAKSHVVVHPASSPSLLMGDKAFDIAALFPSRAAKAKKATAQTSAKKLIDFVAGNEVEDEGEIPIWEDATTSDLTVSPGASAAVAACKTEQTGSVDENALPKSTNEKS